jgi:hypothetical protein
MDIHGKPGAVLMNLTAPVQPSFFTFCIALDWIRNHAVFSYPPENAEVTQLHLQKTIDGLRQAGYETEVINFMLARLVETTLQTSERFYINLDRAHFFAELVRLEMQ